MNEYRNAWPMYRRPGSTVNCPATVWETQRNGSLPPFLRRPLTPELGQHCQCRSVVPSPLSTKAAPGSSLHIVTRIVLRPLPTSWRRLFFHAVCPEMISIILPKPPFHLFSSVSITFSLTATPDISTSCNHFEILTPLHWIMA